MAKSQARGESLPRGTGVVQKICALLEGEDRGLRLAAAQVLGALAPPNKDVASALGRALTSDDGDPQVRRAALDALDAIDAPGMADFVIPVLDEEGDLGRRAMEIVASMDRKVLGALKKRFRVAGDTGRRRILTLAARFQGADGLDLIVRALGSGHSAELREAASRLGPELRDAPSRTRQALVTRIRKFLSSAAAEKDSEAAACAVDLLERVQGAGAVKLLMEFAADDHTPPVRRAALEALARQSGDGLLDSDACSQLISFLGEKDYSNVVAPAMAVLERTRMGAAHAPPLLEFLKGHDPALRRFAISALGQVDSVKGTEALLQILQGDNPDLRSRAARSLERLTAGVKPLVAAMKRAEDARSAWDMMKILAPHSHRLQKAHASELADAAALWLEAGDPRGEPLLKLLRRDHLTALHESSLKRTKRLKRNRDASGIVNLLRPVARESEDGLSVELRYELALAEVVTGSHQVVRAVRLSHPGLIAIAELNREPDFPLLTKLKRDKNYLSPDDYFLIGCHLAEGGFAGRPLGGDLLRWIVATFPEDQASHSATSKLEMEGFPPPRPPKPRAAPKSSSKARPKKTTKAKKATPKRRKS